MNGNQIPIVHPRTCGVLLIGHGTRDQSGLDEFAQTAEFVAKLLPDVQVESAFLELATPDIATGIERLVAWGVRRIVVSPVLLFAAGHAKRDIPGALQVASAKFPEVVFSHTEPLGCHAKLLQLSEQRFRETISSDDFTLASTTLLIVGRGSLDDDATSDMHRYASLLAGRLGVGQYRVAFMAMAQPSLPTVLDDIVCAANGPILVQPHLLFQGDLLRSLQEQVHRIARQQKNRQWRLVGHLGPAVPVAEILAELAARQLACRSLDKGSMLD